MGKETRKSHKNKIKTSMKGSRADGRAKMQNFADVSGTDSISILLVAW
jgi:hypothetical protein